MIENALKYLFRKKAFLQSHTACLLVGLMCKSHLLVSLAFAAENSGNSWHCGRHSKTGMLILEQVLPLIQIWAGLWYPRNSTSVLFFFKSH